MFAVDNLCEGNVCSHLCLLSSVTVEGYVCACPDGAVLLDDGLTCNCKSVKLIECYMNYKITTACYFPPKSLESLLHQSMKLVSVSHRYSDGAICHNIEWCHYRIVCRCRVPGVLCRWFLCRKSTQLLLRSDLPHSWRLL